MYKKVVAVMLLLLLVLAACGKAANPTQAARKAVALARQGKMDQAKKVLLKAHEQYPTNADLVYLLAQVTHLQKDTQGAEKYFTKAISRVSEKEPKIKLIAFYVRFLLNIEKTDKAEKVLKSGFKIAANHPGLLATKKLLNASVGRTAPDFESINILNGRTVKLSSFRGKVVLIDFWASWCGPCRQSLPHLKSIYKKYRGKGLVVIGINLDRTKKAALSYIKQEKLTFINLYDKQKNQQISSDYGVRGIPATFLLDKKGVIRYKGHPMRLGEAAIKKLL